MWLLSPLHHYSHIPLKPHRCWSMLLLSQLDKNDPRKWYFLSRHSGQSQRSFPLWGAIEDDPNDSLIEVCIAIWLTLIPFKITWSPFKGLFSSLRNRLTREVNKILLMVGGHQSSPKWPCFNLQTGCLRVSPRDWRCGPHSLWVSVLHRWALS